MNSEFYESGFGSQTAPTRLSAVCYRIQTISSMPRSEALPFLSGSLKDYNDETLFRELAHRGYDLSKLKDTAPTHTTEILNIS